MNGRLTCISNLPMLSRSVHPPISLAAAALGAILGARSSAHAQMRSPGCGCADAWRSSQARRWRAPGGSRAGAVGLERLAALQSLTRGTKSCLGHFPRTTSVVARQRGRISERALPGRIVSGRATPLERRGPMNDSHVNLLIRADMSLAPLVAIAARRNRSRTRSPRRAPGRGSIAGAQAFVAEITQGVRHPALMAPPRNAQTRVHRVVSLISMGPCDIGPPQTVGLPNHCELAIEGGRTRGIPLSERLPNLRQREKIDAKESRQLGRGVR
jgi:hypothetical protein